jgi:NAD-dependent dihydropyrimidine dehydrogenase PreA subunit
MNDASPMDTFLKGYADKYGEWRKDGSFTVSSRVIPVQKSFTPGQWVLPEEQVLKILRDARSFALTDCTCRTHYQRCDKPRDVCLLVDDLADKAVSHGKARRISLSEASDRLRAADESGLVHLTLYMPGQKIYAVCSCCACCCHDLQLLLRYSRTDLVARSDYITETDVDRCTSCGLCIDRCVFGARRFQDDAFVYDPASCLGCGLCVPVCPEHATVMRLRV